MTVNKAYLFVYGTLRKDSQRKMHRLLSENADFIQKGAFRGKLFMIGGYPGAVPSSNPDDLVDGEVYLLKDNESIISRLDTYEGCSQDSTQPTEYVRKKVDIILDTGNCVRAWIYIYNQSTKGLRRIESGDFLDATLKRKQAMTCPFYIKSPETFINQSPSASIFSL